MLRRLREVWRLLFPSRQVEDEDGYLYTVRFGREWEPIMLDGEHYNVRDTPAQRAAKRARRLARGEAI